MKCLVAVNTFLPPLLPIAISVTTISLRWGWGRGHTGPLLACNVGLYICWLSSTNVTIWYANLFREELKNPKVYLFTSNFFKWVFSKGVYTLTRGFKLGFFDTFRYDFFTSPLIFLRINRQFSIWETSQPFYNVRLIATISLNSETALYHCTIWLHCTLYCTPNYPPVK